MKDKGKGNAGAWVQLCLSVLMLLVPTVIFPVCQSKAELSSGAFAPMRCYYLARASVAISVVMIVNSLTRLCLKGESQTGLKIVQLALTIITVLLPDVLIGACMNATMACRMGTVPGLLVTGGIACVCAIADFILGLLPAKNT